jgi:hypothetical protein
VGQCKHYAGTHCTNRLGIYGEVLYVYVMLPRNVCVIVRSVISARVDDITTENYAFIGQCTYQSSFTFPRS